MYVFVGSGGYLRKSSIFARLERREVRASRRIVVHLGGERLAYDYLILGLNEI